MPERARLILLYERSGRSYETFRLAARREFNLRDWQLPDPRTLTHWIQKFEETGSLGRRPYGRERYDFWLGHGGQAELDSNPIRTARTNETMARIVEMFEGAPNATSIRRASLALNVSHSSVVRALKELDFHPYKMQRAQELSEEDFATRKEFCEEQLEEVEADEAFTQRLCFSDEALFHKSGGINRHNMRYWSRENPHWVGEQPLKSPHLVVWAAICHRGLIGPFFFNGTVNGARYAGGS